MTHPAKTSLKAELGDDLEVLGKLDAAQQRKLLKLIQDARTRQHDSIKAAMDGALSFVPALLRAPVRALFRRR